MNTEMLQRRAYPFDPQLRAVRQAAVSVSRFMVR